MTENLVNDSSATANLGLNQPDTGVKKSLGQHDFLRLMAAQVQNQNPISPQVNGEILSQLTQFSSFSGVVKMQGSIQQLVSSLQSNQALQASALVGRKVLVPGNYLNLGTEGSVNIAIDISSDFANLKAFIYTAFGKLIRTISLGQAPAGLFQFSWDGMGENNQRFSAGKYKVEVYGVADGKEVQLKTVLCLANVDSVSLGQNGEGLKLKVAGIGAVSLDQVRQITV